MRREEGSQWKRRDAFLFKVSEQKGKSLGSQPIAMGEIFLPDLFLAGSSTSCIIVLLMACTVAREKPIISFLSGGNLRFLCTVTNGPITTFFFFCRHPGALNIPEAAEHIEKEQDSPHTKCTSTSGITQHRQHHHRETVTRPRAMGCEGWGRASQTNPHLEKFCLLLKIKAVLKDFSKSRKFRLNHGEKNQQPPKLDSNLFLFPFHYNILENTVCGGGSF